MLVGRKVTQEDEGDDADLYCYDSDEEFEYEDYKEHPRPASTSLTQVITKESLLAAQKADLQRVMELLPLNEHNARALLIQYRWNVEKVLDVFVEKGKDHLFAEAGISTSKREDSASSSSSSPLTCCVCFEDVSSNNASMMDCSHSYCNTCWTAYFIVKIKDGQSRRIKCMNPKCNTVCDETIVRNLVGATNPQIADCFERSILESYIEDNNKVKWCPSVPHCGNAIRVEHDDIYHEVECTCGQQFCFNCLLGTHSPCSCVMWKLWMKKCRDESETVNWITVNTKPCPKCHKHVEKNGGCNLVSCICGQNFCWLCGEATGRDHTWTSIVGHTCGRYEESKVQGSERAKNDLHRYIHYHNRYKLHIDSLNLETKVKVKTQEKVANLESKQSKMIDFSWALNGLNRLFKSRRILAYSYPLAFFIFGNELGDSEITKEQRDIKKTLFEDYQQQLEYNVERLSKALETNFDTFAELDVMQTRLDIINLSVHVDKLSFKMYDYIENDLLDPLFLTGHCIAPYISKGIERASELSSYTDSDSNVGISKQSVDLDSSTDDITGGHERLKHNLSRIIEGECSSKRRKGKASTGEVFLDLNVPPPASPHVLFKS